MPQTNIDYTKIVIYKIVCNDLSVIDVYIGSTTDFTKRKCSHKSNCSNANSKKYNLKVYTMIRTNGGWNNWSMIEIEKFPCLDGNEARLRERYHYELLNAKLNSQLPSRTDKEYRDLNRDKIQEYRYLNKNKMKEYNKEYKKLNKDKIKEYKKLNKDKIKEYQKKYQKEYQKEYRERKKQILNI